MTTAANHECIGFLTVRKHSEHGYFGGLLIVNRLGRPLEFHCSLPLKPSKSQTILYGSTLDEFLCGEMIGNALVSKAKNQPILLFTDSSAVLALRNITKDPLAFIEAESPNDSQLFKPAIADGRLHEFLVEDSALAVLNEYRNDIEFIREFFDARPPQFELAEPFGRVAEALVEAHPSAKAA
jgi:hypothetical protein